MSLKEGVFLTQNEPEARGREEALGIQGIQCQEAVKEPQSPSLPRQIRFRGRNPSLSEIAASPVSVSKQALAALFRASSSNRQMRRFRTSTLEQPLLPPPSLRDWLGRNHLARFRQRHLAPIAEFPNAWLKAKLAGARVRSRGLKRGAAEAIWPALTRNLQRDFAIARAQAQTA